jgi:hypothetical protein
MPRGDKSSSFQGKPRREMRPTEDRYRKHGPSSKRAERIAMKKQHDAEYRDER